MKRLGATGWMRDLPDFRDKTVNQPDVLQRRVGRYGYLQGHMRICLNEENHYFCSKSADQQIRQSIPENSQNLNLGDPNIAKRKNS
jgi:hypothetical protein